ncbi:sensor histidine kinase [Azospirillum sp. sgz301742]
MDALIDFLFDPSGLTPHGFCLSWNPAIIYTHVTGDILMGVSYCAVAVALLIFTRRRSDLEFRPLFIAFITVFGLCGVAHLSEVVTMWVPAYGAQGLYKLLAGGASLVTAIIGWRLLPQALALTSPAQLRAVNARLEQEIDGHRLTVSRLHAAKERAEQASKSKSDFLANMSHELRTPLNAILGFSEALSGEFFGTLNAKQRDYAGYIHFSGAHLLGIINDILDLSKIDAGRLELVREPVDVAEAVTAAIDVIRPKAEEHGVTVTAELPLHLPVIEADGLRLRQILLNLLSNAVKFTPSTGSVRVSARVRDNQRIEIVVSDTGIGMAAQDIPRALEMFTQVGSALTRKYDGTGIGLPLSKALAELHGGRLEIDSAPGRGTTVTVLLPMALATATP